MAPSGFQLHHVLCSLLFSCVVIFFQEGSRQPESAVLWNLIWDFPWVSMMGFQSCSQTAQELMYLQSVWRTVSMWNSYQCLWCFSGISFSQCCLSFLSPLPCCSHRPIPSSKWAALAGEAGSLGQSWMLGSTSRTVPWLMCIAHRAPLTRSNFSHVLLGSSIPSHSNYVSAFWPSVALSCCASSEQLLALPSLKRSDCKISQWSFPFPWDQETSWLLNQAP